MKRIIPMLLVENGRLVKSQGFKNDVYLGDPLNAVRIFNEKYCDEIIIMDIGTARHGTLPDYELIANLAAECFMPLAYGGGISTFESAAKIFSCGVEKVCLNRFANKNLVSEIAHKYGSQSVVASVDVKEIDGELIAFVDAGRTAVGNALEFAKNAVALGAGEIVLNFIEREGTYSGYMLDQVKNFTARLQTPVLVNGGADSINNLLDVIKVGASGAVAGSIFVFHGPKRAVLITYPPEEVRV